MNAVTAVTAMTAMRSRLPTPRRARHATLPAGLWTGLCALAVPGADGRAHARPTQPVGLQYTSSAVVTETDAAGRVTRSPALVGRTRALGPRARVDIVAGNDEIRTGDYLLTADGGRTITMVSPARREYRQLTPDTFGSRLAAELRGRASFSAASVQVERPHPAASTPAVRGTRTVAHDPPTSPPMSPPVSCLRIARAFRLRVRVMLVRDVDLEVHETSDYWLHAALRHVPDPLASYLIADADAPAAADPTLAADTRAARQAAAGAFAVRWVHRTVTRHKSQRTETVTALEVGTVAPVPIDSGHFAVPPGFTRRAPE